MKGINLAAVLVMLIMLTKWQDELKRNYAEEDKLEKVIFAEESFFIWYSANKHISLMKQSVSDFVLGMKLISQGIKRCETLERQSDLLI